MEVTRAYGFSAAHRLADPARSEDENRRIYGKCANVQPHGHDYRFEVTIRGPLDPKLSTVTGNAKRAKQARAAPATVERRDSASRAGRKGRSIQ